MKELALKISTLCNFQGELVWDTSKPNGQPRRMLDTSRAYERFGFEAEWSLERGLEATIAWYRANEEAILKRERS